MAKFKPTNIKGAIDTLPGVQVLRNHVLDVLRRNFESYGYAPIETASVNYLEMLSYKYDENAEIVREIYKIKDQGERDLGLRFDLTVPFCKFIATNRNLKMPFRRYEIGKVWRNGPVKAGRLREFYQCDIDVVGIKEVAVEAEMIALAVKIFRELGIEPIIKYGNRKLLTELIGTARGKREEGNGHLDKIIAVIDRWEKIPREELETELAKFLDKKNVSKLIASFENATHPEVEELQRALEELGVAECCRFTPHLARGLNYYTGTIWEVFDKAGRITSSLGGGGRYDKIITDWIDNGLEYPSVGMAFGLEPIMAVLQGEAGNGKREAFVDMLLVPIGGVGKQAQELASTLRDKGKKVLVWHGGKVGKAMEYADKENIASVIVFGEKEASSGKIMVKDMKTGLEKELR